MTGLILAWVLSSFFNFDELFIQGVKEWFGIEITIAGYYTIFFIVSFVGEVIIAVASAFGVKIKVNT